MTPYKLEVINNFFIMAELLDDDIELIRLFITEKIPIEDRRYTIKQVKRYVENANYLMLDREIEYLLKLPICDYKCFKSIHAQKTIFDYGIMG